MRFLKYILSGLCFGIFSQAAAQSSAIRQVEKKMQEGNWSKSRQMINKLLAKDSLNMEAHLVLAKWFLESSNLNYQFDSAYHHTVWSLAHFKNLSAKQVDHFRKENADSLAFSKLFLKMDSLAFERAKNDNIEMGYEKFLRQFPNSIQNARAIELRDETAYLQALKINSYSAFEDYLKKYPRSFRKDDARQHYDQLLFENRTKDKKLKSYELFVQEFPKNPHREEAAKNIFLIKTASGLPSDFGNFISKYSWSEWAAKARSILFYLPTDEETHTRFESDSLTQIQKLNSESWFPFLKNGKFGFMNEAGDVRMEPTFTSIAKEYTCGGLRDEILSTSSGLINRDGKIIHTSCADVKDIGAGFLLAGDSANKWVIHKSGLVMEENVDDARVLGGRFLIVSLGEKKSLIALNGRLLLPFEKQTIDMMEGVLVVNRYGKKILFRLKDVVAVADGVLLKEEFVFDDAKSVGHKSLLVRNGSLEGLMNDELEFTVPLGRQGLQPTSFGLMRKVDDYFILDGFGAEVAEQKWTKYKLEKQWLLLQNKTASWLADVHTKKVFQKNADSLWVSGGLAFAKTKDSIRVYLNSDVKIALPAESSVAFVKSADSVRYFYSQQKIRKVLYDVKSGEKKLTIEGDQVESIGADLFLVTRKNKRGLMNKSGKTILPFEYDAMLFKSDAVTLLKDKKFGLFQLSTSKLVKPTFTCNLTSIDSAYLIACKNDLYGIIDWNPTSKPLVNFEFNEIRPWGKHLIWARKNFEWSVINYLTGKTIVSKIKNYSLVKESAHENIAIVQQGNFFGVVSNVRGVLIPPTLSYVTNVGSSERPLYFTSKEVEEAGVFVVIYYDQAGQLLRKEVYEESDYEKIVCNEE